MITVDDWTVRERERGAVKNLVALLSDDVDCGRAFSVAAASAGERCVVAGRAVDFAHVFGRLPDLEGPVAPDLLTYRVPRRARLAGELTRRMRVRSALLVRHWEPMHGAVLLVLCSAVGVSVVDARRELAREEGLSR